ncbi:MAG: hypothetical protein Q9225_002355 [Loekoesia sp. 1 TL-2023]
MEVSQIPAQALQMRSLRILADDSSYESDGQVRLNQYIEQRFPNWPKSTYDDVFVLLLRWAADNLEVESEVSKLEKVFQEVFYFATETWVIPSEDPEDALTGRILEFRKGKRQSNLLILYYAGHGGGGRERCIWSATNSEDSPQLNWRNIQGLLLGHPADVLLILDCCQASLATDEHSIGNNWFLGSSVKESLATGVSWRSFTSAMTRRLERAANLYWDDGELYNVQSLNHDLDVQERDLLVTPNCQRLNREHCEPTDLTPLLYPRQRPKLVSSRTEPVVDGSRPRISQGSSPSQRPYKSQTTYPYSGVPRNDNTESRRRDIERTAIEVAPHDCQTLRIESLPSDVEAADVAQWLQTTLSLGLKSVHEIGPLVSAPPYKTTIATFTNVAIAKRALEIQNKDLSSRTRLHNTPVKIDDMFQGFTTLYSSMKSPNDEPDVDVVLIHDAYGHPINSYTNHYVLRNDENITLQECWPRDELPQILETRDVYPRVMTYGWPAPTWLDPGETPRHAVDDLTKKLREVRSNPQRPLVVITHGLGGILAKYAIVDLINFGLAEDDFQNPVKLCVFFGVPHHGLQKDTDFASILKDIKAISMEDGPSMASAGGLQPWNRPFANVSQEFDQLQSRYGIDTLSFVEKGEMERRVAVPKRCASFDNRSGKALDIGSHHQHLARLRRGDDNVGKAMELIFNHVLQKLGRKSDLAPEPEPPNKENIYERLREYDTFFLVDDSESMEPLWRTTARVLAEIVSIAVRYDEDGVDVRFFNKRVGNAERTNLNTTKKVLDLFDKNTPPRGGTLTADILDDVLNEYLYAYRNNRNIKGFNLIVLTDGEPDPGQDVEEVLRYYATELKSAGASRFKVGVQFVQIGGDEKARKFLAFLDDELKGKHRLDRDMIDTVYWVEEDKGRLHEKILLGGILKRLDNDQAERPQRY